MTPPPRRQPDAVVEPVVSRVRIRYAKRGRMRFASHRDFARALERALRLADVPIAHSAGFTPHPKVSYASAATTGARSEAEYVEIGLTREVDVEVLRRALDAALPPGLDVLECVNAAGGSLSDRLDASAWRIELPGVDVVAARRALAGFLAADSVVVARRTKGGQRDVDVRAAVVTATITGGPRPDAAGEPGDTGGARPAGGTVCAIIELVVRLTTPAARPDDVLAGLTRFGLRPTGPARATRLAQGLLERDDRLADPLAPDRAAVHPARSPSAED